VGGVGGLAVVGVGEEEVGDRGDEVEEEGVEDAGVGVGCPGAETCCGWGVRWVVGEWKVVRYLLALLRAREWLQARAGLSATERS
jgi:hypothetical protein